MFRVFTPFAQYIFAAFLTGLLLTSPAGAVEVYFFKGAGDFSFIDKDLHFSRGLNHMADALNKEGIHAEVRRFGATADAMRTIRARKPKSVAFVGHSMGALASMSLAKRMKALGIRVAYVGTIDIPGPIGTAGKNTEWAENYFSVFPVYGKLTNAKTHPKAKNIYVFGQIHTTMDDSKKVRRGILAAIREIDRKEREALGVSDELMMVERNTPVKEPVVVAQAKPRRRLLKIDENPDEGWDREALADRMMVARGVPAQTRPKKRLLKIDEIDPNAGSSANSSRVVISNNDSQFASVAPVLVETRAPQILPVVSSNDQTPINLLAALPIGAQPVAEVKNPKIDRIRTGSIRKVKPNRTIDISNLTRKGKRVIGKVTAFFKRQRRVLKSRFSRIDPRS